MSNLNNSNINVNEVDWQDIETKVQIISRKFSTTIDWKYREDLEQELRIFAWMVSSNYWNMYRKAVDYYRHLTRKVYPETAVYDFTFVDDKKSVEDEYDFSDGDRHFDELMMMLREQISGLADYKKNYDKYTRNALIVLDEIERYVKGKVEYDTQYRGRLNFTRLSENLGISFKEVQDAYWVIKKVVAALVAMKKIDMEKDRYNFEEFFPF